MALELISNPVRVIPKEYIVNNIRNISGFLQVRLSAYGDIREAFNINDLLYLKGISYKGFITISTLSYSNPETIINTNTPYSGAVISSDTIQNTTTAPVEYDIQGIYYEVAGNINNLTVIINSKYGDISGKFNIGDTFYLNNDGFTGGLVISGISFLGGTTRFYTDELLTEIYVGGYILSSVEQTKANVIAAFSQIPYIFQSNDFDYPDYSIFVTIIDADSGQEIIGRDFAYKVDETGKLFLDIKEFVTPFLTGGETKNIRLRYKEYYNGVIQNSTDDEDVLCISATKQIQAIGGTAMWENLLSKDPLGRMLTKFETLTAWNGWAKNFNIIIDAYYQNRNIDNYYSYYFNWYDINKQLLGATSDTGITASIGIHKIQMPAFMTGAVFASLVILANNGAELLQRQFIELKKPCKNPIMIEWLNSFGAYDTWLFEIDQEINTVTDEGQVYETPINAPFDEVRRTTSRDVFEYNTEIMLTAEKLTLSELKALKEIKMSNSVYLWKNEIGGEKIEVIVSGDYSTTHSTNSGLHDIVIRISLPNNFDL